MSVQAMKLKKHGDVNMTEGKIFPHIIKFAIPLLIGNIFQQLYNMVDTWVVGNYVSNEAFAAVGSVGPIINMLIGFFMGFSAGAGVVISQYYGAGDHERVSKTVHTSLLVTLILGVLFTALGIFMAPYMVAFMDTPDNVRPESIAYLTIYFAGIFGLLVYNMGSAILRAVGDSKRPFYFILVSAVINTVLDLLFVIKFNMGVEGVAYATVIAQGISALLIVITLLRVKNCVRFFPSKLAVTPCELKKIVRIGIPTAIQMFLTAFSNVFVQSYINFFGDNCMSGYTAYNKIDQLLLAPIQAISLSATTFVGQNLGIRNEKRARQGFGAALLLSLAVTGVLMIPLIIFAPYIVSFFNAKAAVIEYGALFLRLMSPFYLVCCIDLIFGAVLRGAGNTKVPMIVNLASYVGFRQLYLYVTANFISNTVVPIIFSYPAGWLVSMVVYIIYYNVRGLSSKNVVTEK